MSCCVGVMAFNEADNIGPALRAVSSQKGPHLGSFSITVVASGCTDDTVRRARERAHLDPRIRVLEQPRREGKAAAIRGFLQELADGDVAVITGADTCLEEGALEALVAPFDDPSVGMTGGHPIPLNSTTTRMGRAIHLLWDLHHEVALKKPKLGELVAFRAREPLLVSDTAVDEAWIESLILRRGLRLVYVPDARVRMRGPSTVSDYLTQRRRIHSGHLRLRKTTGHAVSTLSPRRILGALWTVRRRNDRWFSGALLAGSLELAARLLGTWDELRGRDHRVWQPIASTKDLSS